MSERALKSLVGLLIVVGGLWAITGLLSGGGGNRSTAPAGDLESYLQRVRDASEVRIGGPSEDIVLRDSAGTWSVNGYLVNASTMTRFEQMLDGLEVGDLAGSNPVNHARMGVTADSAWTLEVDADGGVLTLLIGNQGPRFATSLVRLSGADEVYLLSGDLRAHLRRPLSEWRDKQIVAVDTSSVRRIEVSRDGAGYALVRGDSAWTIEGAGTADAPPVLNLLMELAGLQAAGFLAPTDSIAELDQAISVAALDSSGGVLADLSIGTGEGDRWIRVAGNAEYYRLSSFRADRIAPLRDRLGPAGR